MIAQTLVRLALQVREEANAAFGSAEEEPTREAADAMRYTVAVLKEALRKCVPCPLRCDSAQ